MNKIDYLGMMVKDAKEFREEANERINRDQHMNDCDGKVKLKQEEIDALLVAFINYAGQKQGIDYALYTHDLK